MRLIGAVWEWIQAYLFESAKKGLGDAYLFDPALDLSDMGGSAGYADGSVSLHEEHSPWLTTRTS